MNFNVYLESKKHQARQRQTEIVREQDQLRSVQRQLEAERAHKARVKAGMQKEMSETLNKIDKDKKEAWNRHHKDDSNKKMTLELIREMEAARSEQKQALQH